MIERPARWVLPQIDERLAAGLSAELGISPLLGRILVKRGLDSAATAHTFLEASIKGLHDPSLLKGMPQAATRLAAAVRRNEKILLYGDYDVDGTSSIVILKKALELAGATADYHVPHRLKDGYGMKTEVIEQAAASGVGLIVSVDTGIRANEVVRHASALGIDVIVTDHHLPEAEIPPAVAVLNPNQPGCSYPEKNLCGAGVTLKLVQALFRVLEIPVARAERLFLSFLKLAAIATVADVVSLAGENRLIVRNGLKDIASTTNPGLRALFSAAGFRPGEDPSAGQIAFRVAPRINAAGRMASARDVIELFLTDSHERAHGIATELDRLNTERQDAEAAMIREAIAMVEKNGWNTDSVRGLVFCGEGWHRGVAGIVASRMVERFHRPVFVLGIDEDKNEAQGSGRSVAGFHLLECLESMTGLLSRFGGHRQAAGLALPIDRVDEFRRSFNDQACARLAPEDLCARYEIDAEIGLCEVNSKSIAELSGLEPYGYGNPSPLFSLRGVRVDQAPVVMKQKHLRFRVSQDRYTLSCKAWNWAGRASSLPVGVPLDLLVSIEDDEQWGLSATVKDARIS